MSMMNKLGNIAVRSYSKTVSRYLCTQSNKGTVKLAYATFQNTKQLAQGPPILFLHGLLGSKRNWQSIAKSISKTGRKTITVDARSHGESPHAADMTYASMASDVVELLHDLGIKQSILVGHSMGGRIAMTIALTQPDLVSQLVVADVSPVGSPADPKSTFQGFLAAMQGVFFDQSLESLSEVRREVAAQLEDVFPDPGVRQFILTNVEKRDDVYQWRVNLDAIGKQLDHLRSFPEFDTSYHGDTLFIGGSESRHLRLEHEPCIKRLFPKAKIQFIAEAGHWVHSDKPHDFLRILNQMINKG